MHTAGKNVLLFSKDRPLADLTCKRFFYPRRPITAKAYGFRSSSNYNRGDPRTWVLEAEVEPGTDSWAEIHRVTNFHFADRVAPVLFHMPDNNIQSSRSELNEVVAIVMRCDVMKSCWHSNFLKVLKA